MNASQIRIIGQEEAGLSALMATALEQRVHSVLLTKTVVSYMSIIQSADYSLALDWFFPGILRKFDAPDIAASISPRPIWMMDAVDASGSIFPVDEVRDRYLHRLGDSSDALKHLAFVTFAGEGGKSYLNWVRVR